VSEPTGTDYLAWNDALARHFFSPEVAGRPVYLFVTDDVLSQVGRVFGGGPEDFLQAIRAGPAGATRATHCQRARQIGAGWRAKNFQYPPYLAYLGLFVLAGGHEGNFDPRSYYPRLWELLGEQGAGTPPSFEHMWELLSTAIWMSSRVASGGPRWWPSKVLGSRCHLRWCGG